MNDASFAQKLREWRGRRGLSQLELAGRADISQRHLSFLELGRSSPSRDMVRRLAAVLEIPLRQQNGLLMAAGYAPEWGERALSAPDLAAVADGLDYMLRHQEPFPGVVVDRQWNLLKANDGAVRMVEFLVGLPPEGVEVNLADALVAPDALRPFLLNWEDVVSYFVRSVESDAAADGTVATAALLERLLGYDGVRSALRRAPEARGTSPVLPMHFRKAGIELRMFTVIATLGTPQDVTLQELRIESFFPMDEATAHVFRSWASPAATARLSG